MLIFVLGLSLIDFGFSLLVSSIVFSLQAMGIKIFPVRCASASFSPENGTCNAVRHVARQRFVFTEKFHCFQAGSVLVQGDPLSVSVHRDFAKCTADKLFVYSLYMYGAIARHLGVCVTPGITMAMLKALKIACSLSRRLRAQGLNVDLTVPHVRDLAYLGRANQSKSVSGIPTELT